MDFDEVNVPIFEDSPKEKKRKRKILNEQIKQVEKLDFEAQQDFVDRYDGSVGILKDEPQYKRNRTKDFKNLFKLPKDASDEILDEYASNPIEFLVRDLKDYIDNPIIKQKIKDSRYDELVDENFGFNWKPIGWKSNIKESQFNKFMDAIFPERKLPKIPTEEKVFIPMTKPLLNSSYFELPPQLRPIVPGSMLYNKNDRMFVVDNEYRNFLVQMISPSEGDDWKYDPTKVIRLSTYNLGTRKMESKISQIKSNKGYYIRIISDKGKGFKEWKANPTNVSFAGFQIYDKPSLARSNVVITNRPESEALPEDVETKKFKVPQTELEMKGEVDKDTIGVEKTKVTLSEEALQEKRLQQEKAKAKELKRREEERKSEALKALEPKLSAEEMTRRDEIKAIAFKKESERKAILLAMERESERLSKGIKRFNEESKKFNTEEAREARRIRDEKRIALDRERRAMKAKEKADMEKKKADMEKKKSEMEKKKAKEKKKKEAKAMFMKMRGKGKI